MHATPAPLMLATLVLAATFGGCIHAPQADLQPIGPSRLAGRSILLAPEGAPSGRPVGGGVAHVVPVHAWYEETVAAVGQGTVMETVNFTGSIRGEALYVARSAPSEDDHPDHLLNFEKNPFTFTGSVPGCGSGSMGFVVRGYFRVDAQGLVANETLQLVPGSTSSGLDGVVDAQIFMDSHDWPAKAAITGTFWCSSSLGGR